MDVVEEKVFRATDASSALRPEKGEMVGDGWMVLLLDGLGGVTVVTVRMVTIVDGTGLLTLVQLPRSVQFRVALLGTGGSKKSVWQQPRGRMVFSSHQRSIFRLQIQRMFQPPHIGQKIKDIL